MTSGVFTAIFVVVLAANVFLPSPYRGWFFNSAVLSWGILGALPIFGPLRDSRYAAWLLIAVTVWGTMLAMPLARLRGGRVLFTFHQTNSGPFLLGSAIFAISAGLQIATALDRYAGGDLSSIQQGFESLCAAIGLGSLAAMTSFIYLVKHAISEQGIVLYKGDIIRWQQIKSFEWQGEAHNQLTIKSSVRRMPVISLSVPLEKKDAVEQLLNERLHNKVESIGASPQPG